MRRLIIFMMVSLDGYFEGPEHELDWHNVDKEFNEFAAKQLDEADILLFGRITYEMMASFWPTGQAKKIDPVVADKMINMRKLVFSKTLVDAGWNNAKLIKENIDKKIYELKNAPGKSLLILGSSSLAVSLIKYGLIDEYRIMVNPVALGKGKSLFDNLRSELKLKLTGTRVFNSGNVMLYYKPI